jgi:O-acetyl-ADP-ribose deacetylase (regulator of RNase III)
MPLRYVTDSILNAPEKYIIHGCNAQGRMGSGLAKVLMEHEPLVRSTYTESYEWHKQRDIPFLGTMHYVACDKPHVFINAITQENAGNDGALYVSYEAVEKVFTMLNSEAERINRNPNSFLPEMKAVAIPLIGCGLGGARWSIVHDIIELTATNYEPVIYIPDGKIPL